MSNLGVVANMTNNERSNTAKVFNTTSMFLIFAVTVLAVYLAIRDMGLQVHSSTKIWVFILAIFEPVFYVVLHGISTSLSGVGFFQSSPIVGSSLGGSLDMSSLRGAHDSFSNSLSSLSSASPL